MKQTTQFQRPGAPVTVSAIAAALLLAYGGAAQAFEFETENGWSGSLNTTLSIGASWRTEAPDSKLFSAADGTKLGIAGGTGGSNTDSGDLNWGKGDRFSTPLKAVIDLSFKKDQMGVFARAKAWDDLALTHKNARAGNGDQNYTANSKLSDASQPALNKFSGVELLDAYAYNSFDVGGKPLQLRVGKQVVNWGESLFIQGLNQLSPVDVPALRKPGTEVKEALLPVWSILGSLGLGGGASLDAFYQMKWEQTIVDSCGGYWSPVEFALSTSAGTGCRLIATTIPGGADAATSNAQQTTDKKYVPLGQGKDGKDSGQFGLALRFPVAAIDSEIGAYAMRINSRVPVISGRTGTDMRQQIAPFQPGGVRNPNNLINAIPAYAAAGFTSSQAFWEYPDGINIYGLSLSTNLAGWSVGAELSRTPNQPVQINGNDLLAALLAGGGPMGATAKSATAQGVGTSISGYTRMTKTQFQVNTIKILPEMLGASQGLLVAEVAGQQLDLPNDGLRYGRAFIFGLASHPLIGGNNCGTAAGKNPQVDGCQNAGFVTSSAWGYRVKASLDYPGLIAGATVTPSIFFGHDVSGYSSDSQFIQDRQALTLGVKFDFQKKYALDLGYTTFSNSAKYDPFRDRDFYSAAFSMTF